MLPPRAAGRLCGLAAFVLVTSCSPGSSGGASGSGAAVPVPVPSASPSGCRRLAAKLPDSLGSGLDRRRTSPEDPRVAAYGDPPVVIRCGAPVAASYRRGTPLVSVNGVAWFQQVRDGAVVWSTPTSFVNVEVVVPTAYDAQGGLLARLTEPVKAAGF